MRIQTVLGMINASELGVTYMHEHLIIDSPIVKSNFQHISLPSIQDATSEVNMCVEVGVSALVDCMPMGSGRDIRKLAEISKNTGVHIISATGLHHSRYYKEDDIIENSSTDELTRMFIDEIMVGAEGSNYKTGIIKTVSSGASMSAREIRLFEAAAAAHNYTGAPILTHCEHGVGALEQIELLNDLDVNLKSVTLSHTDKVDDLGYHRAILESGVFVEYDQCLRQIDEDSPSSAQLTAAMINEGFGDQIMLGTDGARRTLWRTLGGQPGLSALYQHWGKKLLELGVESKNIEKIFISNPSRALAFREKNVN